MNSIQAAIAAALVTLVGGVVATAIAVNVYQSGTSSLESKIETGQQRVNEMQDRGVENMRKRIGNVEKPGNASSFR